jgi:hypothetical protein
MACIVASRLEHTLGGVSFASGKASVWEGQHFLCACAALYFGPGSDRIRGQDGNRK